MAPNLICSVLVLKTLFQSGHDFACVTYQVLGLILLFHTENVPAIIGAIPLPVQGHKVTAGFCYGLVCCSDSNQRIESCCVASTTAWRPHSNLEQEINCSMVSGVVSPADSRPAPSRTPVIGEFLSMVKKSV